MARSTWADDPIETYLTARLSLWPAILLIGLLLAGVGCAGQEKEAEPEFLLPLAAIFTADGQMHKVWILDEATMTVNAHEVTRTRLTARGQYVKGLMDGMLVAAAGANTLREGQKVKIAEPTRRSERPQN